MLPRGLPGPQLAFFVALWGGPAHSGWGGTLPLNQSRDRHHRLAIVANTFGHGRFRVPGQSGLEKEFRNRVSNAHISKGGGKCLAHRTVWRGRFSLRGSISEDDTVSCRQNWAAQTAVGSTPKNTSAPQGGEGVERSSEGWEGGPLTEPPRTPPLSCVPRAEAPPAGASAAASVEVDAASQASEPASQASDEEDAPSTDIYFVSPRSLPTPVAPEVPVDSHTCLCPGSSLGVTEAGPLLGHGETRAKAEAQKSGWSFWGQVLFMMVGPGDPGSGRSDDACCVRWGPGPSWTRLVQSRPWGSGTLSDPRPPWGETLEGLWVQCRVMAYNWVGASAAPWGPPACPGVIFCPWGPGLSAHAPETLTASRLTHPLSTLRH